MDGSMWTDQNKHNTVHNQRLGIQNTGIPFGWCWGWYWCWLGMLLLVIDHLVCEGRVIAATLLTLCGGLCSSQYANHKSGSFLDF